jgi:hypothetical protein
VHESLQGTFETRQLRQAMSEFEVQCSHRGTPFLNGCSTSTLGLLIAGTNRT